MTKSLQNILWTALITPFDHHGAIDFDGLKMLLRMQQEAGNGILLLGSTGEGIALPEGLKKRLIDFVSDQNLTVPIMIGVNGYDLSLQKDWIKFCKDKQVDAFSLVTPIYSRPGYHGQLHWFKTLLDFAEKPCMLYNVPSRTACSLDVEAFCELSKHPNCFALKEACGSLEEFRKYKEAIGNGILYSGNDELFDEQITIGAQGLVGVFTNLWPRSIRGYVEGLLQGRVKEEQRILFKKVAKQIGTRNPLPVKYLLYKNGLIESSYVYPPLSSLDLVNKEELDEINKEMLHIEQMVLA